MLLRLLVPLGLPWSSGPELLVWQPLAVSDNVALDMWLVHMELHTVNYVQDFED